MTQLDLRAGRCGRCGSDFGDLATHDSCMAFMERASGRGASRARQCGRIHSDASLTRRRLSDQTTFSEIAEITARGALYQVDGELEQTNFPRVVYALYDRAERFVFVFDLPPGAIDHRVD